MTYVFAPAAPPTLSVTGITSRFPVRRIWCVGRNYAAHAREMGGDDRDPPFFFAKQPDMVVPDGGRVAYPSLTANLHHEVELVVALKAGGVNIELADAPELIFGFGVGLDLTRRDLQNEAKDKRRPWEASKSFEQSAPCGPITPIKVAGDVAKGRIRLTVNGAVRQQSPFSEMIWSVPEIIAQLSRQVALAAGDVIFTGTPEGVAAVMRGDRLLGEATGLEPIKVEIA